MRKKSKLLGRLVFQALLLGVKQGSWLYGCLCRLKLAAEGRGHPTVSITCCYLENLISWPAIDLLSSPA